jgi:hypothetical protein
VRYFLADPVAYEQARVALNAAWGIPRPGTETALPVVGNLLVSGDGKVVVMVDDWMVDLPPAPDIVEQATAAGTLSEITEADVLAMLPQTL